MRSEIFNCQKGDFMAGIGTAAALGAATSALKGGVSNGGSSNSGFNASNYANESYSSTDAASAREWAAEQARIAFERQKELMQMEMDYNREEAQKSRDWNESMANTVYTRSVNNMKEAGINPVLAASMGLSGASVGSAQTASIGGASAPLAQSFMDTTSASHGAGQSYGESHGSSWSHSENGIATGLGLLADAIGGAIEKIGSSQKIDIAIDGLKDLTKEKDPDKAYSKVAGTIGNILGVGAEKAKDFLMSKDSGKYKALTGAMSKQPLYTYQGSGKLINQK